MCRTIFMKIRKYQIIRKLFNNFFLYFYVYLLSSLFLACQSFLKIFVCLLCFVFIDFLVFEFCCCCYLLKKFSVNHKSR